METIPIGLLARRLKFFKDSKANDSEIGSGYFASRGKIPIVFPLFGLGFGLELGLGLGLGLELGLEFGLGLGLGLGLFWHLRQNTGSRWDYFASKWQNNMGLFGL